jgi:hypothetical protein
LINTPWVVPWKQPIGWRPAPFLFSRKTLVGYIAISLLTRGYISYIPTQTYMLLGKKTTSFSCYLHKNTLYFTYPKGHVWYR